MQRFLSTDGSVSPNLDVKDKPDLKAPEPNLLNFLKTASPQDVLEQLIIPISWSSDSGNEDELRDSIRSDLRARGEARTISTFDSDRALDRLFRIVAETGKKGNSRVLNRDDFRREFDEATLATIPIGELTALRSAAAANMAGCAAVPPKVILSPDVVREICRNISKPLLDWPTDIDGQRMEPAVFEELAGPIDEDETNVQMLIGEPGSGKSALLAKLGARFLEEGALVLAIKADQLPKSVDTVSSLGEYLGLGGALCHSLRSFADSVLVVVLIDQLDALSDLVDLDGGRLNALLHFINELGGTQNLRVIASCRQVEFRHDARLTFLAPREVRLPLPEWEEVVGLLELRGIDARGWTPTFHEILRRPQQLLVFTQLVASGEEMPVFSSYQQMLERLWQHSVTNQDGIPGRAELVREVARFMGQEEMLWVSRSRFEDRAEALNQLIAAGILTPGADERTFGFRHQTVFDFALSRSFATEGRTLSDYVFSKQQSLFVRPRLWSALVYLRGAEPETYHKEFDILWQHTDLKLHVRMQLVEFLGQLEDPNGREELRLRQALADESCKRLALIAIQGRNTWFQRLRPDILPELMAEPSTFIGEIARILQGAVALNATPVLGLLRDYWITNTEYDWYTSRVLSHLPSWDSDSTSLAEILAARHDSHGTGIFNLVSLAANSQATMAISIFAAYLQHKVAESEALTSEMEKLPGGNVSIFSRSPRHDAAESLLDGSGSALWPDLQTLAETSPAFFLDKIWPLFRRLLSIVRCDDLSEPHHFGYEGILRDRAHGHISLVEAVDSACEALAAHKFESFSIFLAAQGPENSMTIQCALANALSGVTAEHPDVALSFLLEDPRRLNMDDPYHGEHRYTGLLISTLSEHLSLGQMETLEAALTGWTDDQEPRPDDEPDDLIRANQGGRIRLLRYIPSDHRTERVVALVAELEAEFPDLRQGDGFVLPGYREKTQSMSSGGIEKATLDELRSSVEQLVAGGIAESPPGNTDNGISSHRALPELAKRQPSEALLSIDALNPSTNGVLVGHTLSALAESELSNDELLGAIRKLIERGFGENPFHELVADALSIRLEKGLMLPEDFFGLLESWLDEAAAAAPPPSVDEAGHLEKEEASPLWRPNVTWMRPRRTFCFLKALNIACYNAEQADRFVAIMKTHLERPEQVEVWRALCWYLKTLRMANPTEASSALLKLFRKFPAVMDSIPGVRAIFDAFSWLPGEAVRTILEDLKVSTWPSAERSFGELLMFRHAYWNEERSGAWISALVGDPNTSTEILRGIATTAAHVLPAENARGKAAVILNTLIPGAAPSVAVEILGVFDILPEIGSNPHAIQLLRTMLENPSALIPDSLQALIQALPQLIPVHSMLAADLADTILDHHAEALFDQSKAFALTTEDLINFALTLHRDEGGRERGLNLFERLLQLNIDGTRTSLFEVDARPIVAPHPVPRPSPRRRRVARR